MHTTETWLRHNREKQLIRLVYIALKNNNPHERSQTQRVDFFYEEAMLILITYMHLRFQEIFPFNPFTLVAMCSSSMNVS